MGKGIVFSVDEEKFFSKCVKHQNLPKNDALKQILLKRVMQEFDAGRAYSEIEVNDTIKKYFQDYTSLRRELLNFDYMQREPSTGEWTVVKKELEQEDYLSITRLRRHTKDLGVFKEHMPTRDDCLRLLEKHGIRGRVLKHSLEVNRIAVFLGKKLEESGIDINIELLDAASLLHDIGKRLADETDMGHVVAGVRILEEEGFPQVAEIVGKHSITAIVEGDKTPVTWEEKLVFYADKRVRGDELVSLDERLADLRKRYPEMIDLLEKAEPNIRSLEKEIFDRIDVTIDLKGLKP